MNRLFFNLATALGALALAWVAAGFAGSNLLALLMTLLIAAGYGLGTFELQQFRKATDDLVAALAKAPEGLTELQTWLKEVPAELQNPVRLRIEGERAGLPGPALTPYLLGLLVMLGMLGTFLGMVVTLNGAVFALEGSPDLEATRQAFATPIKGLGLAFGTSVAGVAASAMLGLMSALSRRERLQASQLLDSRIAGTFRHFSLGYQRQQSYLALQQQAQALPAVLGQMQSMMAQMERMSQELNGRLLANQERFHGEVKGAYTALARDVSQSLQNSLAASVQAAGDSLKPVVALAMSGIADNASQLHTHLLQTSQQQLATLTERMQDSTAALLQNAQQSQAALQADQAAHDRQRLAHWQQSLDAMVATLGREWQQAGLQAQAHAQQVSADVARLINTSEEQLRSRIASEAQWTQQQSDRMGELAGLLRGELGRLRDEEAQRGQAAIERLGALQSAVAAHLSNLGTALETPITRLIQTASEAPRAAAEVIATLREQISKSVERDNALLEERSRILQTLNQLLDSIRQASAEQRSVIGAQAARLTEVAAQVGGSAVEVSALGQTFGFAVQSFGDANDKLIANLQRIEAALDKSLLRSDDQLAYYVAQAREVIDLSILSQKEVVDALRQLPRPQAAVASEAA